MFVKVGTANETRAGDADHGLTLHSAGWFGGESFVEPRLATATELRPAARQTIDIVLFENMS